MTLPRDLRLMPFRGSAAIASGLLTWKQLRGPRWRRLLPDVYVAADVAVDHRLWSHAALVYAGPVSAISGLSAARLWGAPVGRDDDPVEITVPSSRWIRFDSPKMRLLRRNLPDEDVGSIGLISLTTPERTALDLSGRQARADAVIAIESFLGRDLVSWDSLDAFGAQQAGTRAGRLLSHCASLANPRSESPMETRCRLVMLDGGLPAPMVQYEVFDGSGRFVARLDLAYKEWKIGIEYEGDHHRERSVFQRDLARLNMLTALGWVVVRATARDIYREPEQLVHQLKTLIARRAIRST
jgi:hypothetical protein